jgi:integrase
MAYLEERISKDGKKSYRVQVRLKGFKTATATFQRKTDAVRWAQQTEAAMREGRHFKTNEAKKHTVADVVDRYIENVIPTKPRNARVCTAQLLWWKQELGHAVLADVTPALLAEKRDQLLKGITHRGIRRGPATVVRYLAALSHAFAVAQKEWGWMEDNPLRRVTKPKEPRGRVRYLDDKEREALLKACQESNNPYLFPVVVLALSTGMRQGEIMNLRWEDVDLLKGRIVLHETKNGERRVVPLRGYALELLKQLKQAKGTDLGLLFPSKNGRSPMILRAPWEQALKRAGIKDYRFHDNRHSCASYLLAQGATLAQIAEVLGHKTLQMVKRYAHLPEADASRIVEDMNKSIFG